MKTSLQRRALGLLLLSLPATALAHGGSEGFARAVMPPRRGLVFLDPGHGGRDPGAVVAGMVEKTVVLEIALQLGDALTQAGFDVAFSRRDDRHVGLDARVAMARAAGADLFLSLHADAVTKGEASGASVYRLAATATDSLAAELADNANASVDVTAALAAVPRDLRAALGAMMLEETNAQTDALAALIVEALGERVPLLQTRPLRAAAFRVLMAPDIPSVLIELGFLSSAADRARLADPAWREKAVAALVTGVERWFSVTESGACAQRACQTGSQ